MVLTQKTIGGIRLGNATISKIHKGTSQIWPTYVPGDVGPGIYWKPSLGLISISYFNNDYLGWLTIADKNLGATEARHPGNTVTVANRGDFYQYGNNHGFSFETAPQTVASEDITGYGPNNPYYSEYWCTDPNRDFDDVAKNPNMWGWEDYDNGGDLTSIQGPCPAGYHLFTQDDINVVSRVVNELGLDRALDCLLFPDDNLMVNNQTATLIDANVRGHIWPARATDSLVTLGEQVGGSGTRGLQRWQLYSKRVRPVKNVSVVPDDSWICLVFFPAEVRAVSWQGEVSVGEEGWAQFSYKNATNFVVEAPEELRITDFYPQSGNYYMVRFVGNTPGEYYVTLVVSNNNSSTRARVNVTIT